MTDDTRNPTHERSPIIFYLQVAGLLSIILYGSLFTYAAVAYLSWLRHPVVFASVSIVTVTLLSAVLFWLVTSRSTGWIRTTTLALTFTITVLLPASAIWPGTITHHQFGVTVVGLQPVPVLDLTISSNGIPWFRYKDHSYDENEVGPFDDADIIVLGTGWTEGVKLDDDLRQKIDTRLIVRPSGKAVRTYNRLLNEGKSVSLLLHTTC